MTPRPQTFVEHDILSLDASRGIHYQSFDDFWQKRMEPMQFIPAGATGALRACRELLKQRAQEQWMLWSRTIVPPGLECGGSPQAGGLLTASSHGTGGAPTSELAP